VSDEIIVISPEIEPGAGGLADYTLRVVEQWRSRARVCFILPKAAAGASPASREDVELIERSAEDLLANLPESGGRVLLQYSAYGFDHFGYPRWLLRSLGDWRQKSGGTLVVMLHEIWGFWPILNKNYLVQQLHRRDLRTLISRADSVFTSTASQADHLRALWPACAVEVLPVGTNILPRFAAPIRREQKTAVLFGLQGSRIHALQTMHDELRAAAGVGRIQRVVTVGGGASPAEVQREGELLRALQLSGGFEQCGPLVEGDVSELLAAARFAVSAQDELSVTKSGTFMAYAAHGMNILSPFARSANSEPLCWTTHPSELAGSVSDDELRARAESLRDWQERTCSWAKIAEQFARALHLGVQSEPNANAL
jgi:hypothetical protein